MCSMGCTGSVWVKFRFVLSILIRCIYDKMLVVFVLCFVGVAFFKGRVLVRYFDNMLSDVPWDARGQIYAAFITSFLFFLVFLLHIILGKNKKLPILSLIIYLS